MSRRRVVILSSRLPEDIWLINCLSAVCDIGGVVLPLGSRYSEFGIWQVLRKTVRRSGIAETLNQSAMYVYRQMFERRRDERAFRQIFAGEPWDKLVLDGVPILCVEDINAPEVERLLRHVAPELVVVSGTSLLKPGILDSADCPILNLHTGLAPEYRGRYGAYWPIYHHEPAMVGVTVHLIDRGIDTGPILAQQRLAYHWNDTAKTITYKQHRLGGAMMVDCVRRFDELSRQARRPEGRVSRNFRTMGLREYLQARLWIRRSHRGQVINAATIADTVAETLSVAADALPAGLPRPQ